METTAQRVANLGYFAGFMRAYGKADTLARNELYRDTLTYRYGGETAQTLYGQVTMLLGVPTPPLRV